MKTLYLNANEQEVTWNKRHYLLAAAERLGFNDPIDQHVITYDPAVHRDMEYVLNIEPFKSFATGTKWTGVWEIDVMLDRQEMKIDYWNHCDTVFIAHSSLPERMAKYGGNLEVMFQACDPVMTRRFPEIEQTEDFVICGTVSDDEVYSERSRLYRLLVEKGFSFKDHGKGHPPDKYAKILNTARVQFVRAGHNFAVADSQVAQRFFECLAIGPVLKDYHPDLETLGLVEGTDFYWYKDDKEMLKKMKTLVDNPDFARVMAENGRKKALMYHTYEHRLMSILNFANEHER